MKSIRFITTVLALMYCTSPVGGEENAPVRLPSRDNFHLFLLAGQSNMAGRGEISAEDKKVHPRVFMLSKGGTWKPAVDPIHYDKKVAGVGLGKSFAIRLAQINEDISIGLVPAACGGSPISSWQPGGYHDQTDSHPYDDAIKRMRHAMKHGVIKGILWHQGESDCTEERAPEYKEKQRGLIDRFRKDLNAPSVPFIIGQLGQFPERPWNDQRHLVNEAHISLSEETPLVGFVSSEALTCKQDRIHFDANSLRRFGRRYADVYLEIAEQGAAAEQDATTPAYTFEKEIDKTIRYTYILHLPDIPVWVFSGGRDRFLVEQGQTVESALRWGVDVVYTVFPEADHGGAKREAMKIQAMLDWLTSEEDLRSPNARRFGSAD